MIRFLLVLALVGCGGETVSPREPAPASRARAPATEASAQAAYDAKQWDACGEQYSGLAATGPTGMRRWMLWSAAGCYAQGGKADLAFASMNAVVADGVLDTD